MKNIIKLSASFLFFSLLWFGCKKSTSGIMDLSGTYAISINETQKIPSGANFATLTLVDIVDTRCPPNANCVNSGSVKVTVKFKDGLINQTIDLCLGTCTKELKTIKSRGINYIISLSEVLPEPTMYFYLSSLPPTAKIELTRM